MLYAHQLPTTEHTASCLDLPGSKPCHHVIQLWLFNPDYEWPGHPEKPGGDGWIWVRDEADAAKRFTGFPTVEVVAARQGHLSPVHETLSMFGIDSARYGIGGYTSPGYVSVRALGRRGGAWVRRVADPPWLQADQGMV